MEKKLTYLDVLEDTIKYYSEDLSRRAMVDGTCVYLTATGEMCAVGRCMEKPELHNLPVIQMGEANLIKALKPEYQHLTSLKFWNALQKLHDWSCHWDKENGGLSATGEKVVECFKNGLSLLQK